MIDARDDHITQFRRRIDMFGKPPFFIPDTGAVDVWNLAAARAWYREQTQHVVSYGESGKEPQMDGRARSYA
jgi:hypothetical protein